jgi:surfeit locus 1 family protein
MTSRQARMTDFALPDAGRRPRSRVTLIALAASAMLAFAGFAALGTWQLFRLQWKLALIDRVEHRVHASPVPAPGPAQWPQIQVATDEYRHVHLAGTFLYDRTTPVQATTVLGFGYWLLTPLRGEDGSVVLVNRGFVSADALHDALDARSEESAEKQDGNANKTTPVAVTGLLRMTEPGGTFMRHNDPAGNRWYSRDVQAIAAARGLEHVAPYFVDADAAQDASAAASVPERPVGGLTVVSFRNNHFAYALTWYALALMVAGAAFWAVREERRERLHPAAGPTTGSHRDRAHGERQGNR